MVRVQKLEKLSECAEKTLLDPDGDADHHLLVEPTQTYSENLLVTFSVILLTTNQQTDKCKVKHNLLDGGDDTQFINGGCWCLFRHLDSLF